MTFEDPHQRFLGQLRFNVFLTRAGYRAVLLDAGEPTCGGDGLEGESHESIEGAVRALLDTHTPRGNPRNALGYHLDRSPR